MAFFNAHACRKISCSFEETESEAWKSCDTLNPQSAKMNRVTFPKTEFERLVREIAQNLDFSIRFEGSAIEALQVAAEDYTIRRFASTVRVAVNSRRSNLMAKYMHVV